MAVDLNARLASVAELVTAESILELVKLIWANDRYFTFPAFQATAKALQNRIKDMGLQGKIYEVPADGTTVLGDWKMPLAWDCTDARLEIVEAPGGAHTGRVIADRANWPRDSSDPTNRQARRGAGF